MPLGGLKGSECLGILECPVQSRRSGLVQASIADTSETGGGTLQCNAIHCRLLVRRRRTGALMPWAAYSLHRNIKLTHFSIRILWLPPCLQPQMCHKFLPDWQLGRGSNQSHALVQDLIAEPQAVNKMPQNWRCTYCYCSAFSSRLLQ